MAKRRRRRRGGGSSVIFNVDFSPLLKKVHDLAKVKINKNARANVGRQVVHSIKDRVAKGLSPVKGLRYKPYKGGYRKDIQKGRIQGKKLRPINLEVTGEFLKSLTYRTGKRGVMVGYFDDKYAKYEKGHAEGHNGQEIRPTIPQGNQTFSSGILTKAKRDLKSWFVKRLKITLAGK